VSDWMASPAYVLRVCDQRVGGRPVRVDEFGGGRGSCGRIERVLGTGAMDSKPSKRLRLGHIDRDK